MRHPSFGLVGSILCFALCGCVQREFIVLKNPTTGEVKECQTNSGASFFPIAQTAMDNSSTRSCAQGYEAAGFKRMN